MLRLPDFTMGRKFQEQSLLKPLASSVGLSKGLGEFESSALPQI
jgi:hypothetical protein